MTRGSTLWQRDSSGPCYEEGQPVLTLACFARIDLPTFASYYFVFPQALDCGTRQEAQRGGLAVCSG
jgi:hypothetical protein